MKSLNFVRPSVINIDRISLPAMLLATTIMELEQSQVECEIAENVIANSSTVDLRAHADVAYTREKLEKNRKLYNILHAELFS